MNKLGVRRLNGEQIMNNVFLHEKKRLPTSSRTHEKPPLIYLYVVKILAFHSHLTPQPSQEDWQGLTGCTHDTFWLMLKIRSHLSSSISPAGSKPSIIPALLTMISNVPYSDTAVSII